MQNQNGHPPPPYSGAPAPGYGGYPAPYPQTGAAPGYPAPYPQTGAAPGYPAPPYGVPQMGVAPGPYGMPQTGTAPGYGRPGIMSGLGDVDPTGSRLPHFNAGHRYLVRLEKLEFFQGRQASFVASEWHILESDDGSLPPGRDGKYMIKWGQDMSLPNFKALVGALEGLTDDEQIKSIVTEQKGMDAIGPAQPYKGRILELRTTPTTTKQGKPFTVHNWLPAVSSAGQFGGANPASVTASGHYVPPQSTPFPPPGWFPHPQAPGAFHNGREIVSEADLRARAAQGRA